MDETVSTSCVVAGFGISGAELSGSVAVGFKLFTK